MIERLLENWLDNCSERSLQFAFCQMLIDKDHTIVHSSRHAPIEHGKDIISLDQSGKLCAFQLKAVGGRKLSKTALSEILNQLNELVMVKIEHTSIIDSKEWHQSFLVLNGELEEEASDMLTKWNEGWVQKGHAENKVKTIVRGELLDMAKSIAGRLFPAELVLFKSLLEIYLEEGNGMIPKDKLSQLLLDSLPMLNSEVESVTAEKGLRAITATAIINSVALSSFSERNNHYAEIEGWILYVCHLAAIIDKFDLTDRRFDDSLQLIEDYIYSLLDQLVEEVIRDSSAIEGNALTDQPFYRIRVTLLCGLISIYSLWNMQIEGSDDREEFCRDFVKDRINKAVLWGEAAVPQFINTFWYLKKIDSTPKPDFLIAALLDAICIQNNPKSPKGLPNPYYDAESVALAELNETDKQINDSFLETAFTAEALLHLFVRRNWKQHMKRLWPAYTRIMCSTTEFGDIWLRYLWRVQGQGVNRKSWPELTKNWERLKDESFESSGANLPRTLKKHPFLFLLYLIVYPHRCDSESVRWLDTHLTNVVAN